jgi:hypothetical protein
VQAIHLVRLGCGVIQRGGEGEERDSLVGCRILSLEAAIASRSDEAPETAGHARPLWGPGARLSCPDSARPFPRTASLCPPCVGIELHLGTVFPVRSSGQDRGEALPSFYFHPPDLRRETRRGNKE